MADIIDTLTGNVMYPELAAPEITQETALEAYARWAADAGLSDSVSLQESSTEMILHKK